MSLLTWKRNRAHRKMSHLHTWQAILNSWHREATPLTPIGLGEHSPVFMPCQNQICTMFLLSPRNILLDVVKRSQRNFWTCSNVRIHIRCIRLHLLFRTGDTFYIHADRTLADRWCIGSFLNVRFHLTHGHIIPNISNDSKWNHETAINNNVRITIRYL